MTGRGRNGKCSCRTELFQRGRSGLGYETVAWTLPVQISRPLQNRIWWDERFCFLTSGVSSSGRAKCLMWNRNCRLFFPFLARQRCSCQDESSWYLPNKASEKKEEEKFVRRHLTLCLLTVFHFEGLKYRGSRSWREYKFTCKTWCGEQRPQCARARRRVV